jgi:hypothetical protein
MGGTRRKGKHINKRFWLENPQVVNRKIILWRKLVACVLARDRVWCQAFLAKVMNFWFHKNEILRDEVSINCNGDSQSQGVDSSTLHILSDILHYEHVNYQYCITSNYWIFFLYAVTILHWSNKP